MHNIRESKLTYCKCINNETIIEISLLSHIEILDLSECKNISNVDELRNFRELYLQGCLNINLLSNVCNLNFNINKKI